MRIYEHIVAPIIRHLKDTVPSCAVEEMPDSPESYKLAHPNAALLVHYPGSGYTERGATVQQRRSDVDIYIIVRRLSGEHGAYAYMDAVLSSLHNFKPGDVAGRMFPVRDRLVDHQPDRWQYVVSFAFSSPHAGQLSTITE